MDGRVLQVNVSPGGVPKLPVDGPVPVGRFGLEGDGHHDRREHGGPHRAVALFAIEAIRRVEADGNPIFPGSCGENLTTEGIELSTLPIGTRLAIGDEVVLELASPDGPCETIAGSFRDGRFGRISILTHPTDSRMYARVITEGRVAAGDPIRVLEASDGRATQLAMLGRVEAARRAYWIANWRAVEAAGIDIRYEIEGDIAMSACPAYPGPSVNMALGFERLPNLLPEVTGFFEAQGVPGWVDLEPRDVPASVPESDRSLAGVHAIEPDRVRAAAVDGLRMREIDASESQAWVELMLAADPPAGSRGERLRRMAPHLLGPPAQAHRRLFIAELGGRPVAGAASFTRRKTGWLAAAAVLEEARGRGIQRALIAHRAGVAAEDGCDLIALDASPDEPSARNALGTGMVEIGTRVMVPVGAIAGG
jgi:MOSC domain-containing protein YiiM/GNAT superfamily N-acetyltransferase